VEEALLNFARQIAAEAGKILLSGFRSKDTVISYKSRTDLLTNIDTSSEEFLVSRISDAFPDHAIVAEEGSNKEASGEFIWYIDPLDGTNNFAHGIPQFCVSIGVLSRAAGKVVAGAVYNPCLDEMFTARRGHGAFLNGKRIRVSILDDIGVCLIATGFPYKKDDMKTNNSREFSLFLPRIQGIRRMGSAAVDLCYVACGRFDGYWEGWLNPWDMAAGSLIVQEAGGTVTRYNGAAFDPTRPEIVASNGLIHAQMTEILSL
jgi:myo-inositol-1(or 4)-monophosphatase